MGAVGTARARTPRGPGGRPVRLGAAVLTVLTAGVVVAGCGSSVPTPPRTVRVERASVSTSVSAVGSVSSSQVNVGFPQGGQLTSVRVAVGDRVTRGQVLATVDSYAARQALRQAEAQRDSQQAEPRAGRGLDLGRRRRGRARAGETDPRRHRARRRPARVGGSRRCAAAGAAGASGAAGAAGSPAGASGGSGAAGDLQVEQARQGVVQAQNNLDAARRSVRTPSTPRRPRSRARGPR